MPGCLTEIDVARFVAHELSPDELLAVDDHIAGCDACRAQLSAREDVQSAFTAAHSLIVETPVGQTSSHSGSWQRPRTLWSAFSLRRPFSQYVLAFQAVIVMAVVSAGIYWKVKYDQASIPFAALVRKVITDKDKALRQDCLDGKVGLVLFDDVKVYAGKKVFLDVDFDNLDAGSRYVPGMHVIYDGKTGFVTNGSSASAPSAWASVATSGWARADGIDIKPEDVPTGEKLVIEASVMVASPGASARIGLAQPWVRDNNAQDSTPVLCTLTDDGTVFAKTSSPQLLHIERLRWYRLHVECDLAAHAYDISLDGHPLATHVAMTSDEQGRRGLALSRFEIQTHFTVPSASH